MPLGKIIVIVLSIMIIGGHLLFVLDYSINIPKWDDYDSVLRFINQYLTSHSVSERIRLIFSRHNEHRIVLDRVFVLLDKALFGKIDFRHLIFFGNFLLVSIFCLVFYLYSKKNTNRSWILFLPVPLMIFDLNSSDNYLWAMAVIANVGVIFFSFSSIVVLFSSSIQMGHYLRMIIALVFSVIATFTNGSGFLTLPICFMGLLINRRWRLGLIWLVASVLILIFHFYEYPVENEIFETLFTKPDQVILHFLILLGNYFVLFQPYANWSTSFLGIIMLLVFLYFVFVKKIYLTDFIQFGIICFLMLSCALISLSRAHLGFAQAFAGRYVIYSTFLVVFLYFLVLDKIGGGSFSFISVIFVLIGIYHFCSFIQIARCKADNINQKLLEGAKGFNRQIITEGLLYPDESDATAILIESEKLGVYKLPERDLSRNVDLYQNLMFPLPKETGRIRFNIESIKHEPDLVVLSGWLFPVDHGSDNSKLHVALVSSDIYYIFQCQKRLRGDVSAYFNINVDYSGFKATILREYVKDGTYDVGLIVEDSDILYFQYTGRKVSFLSPK